MTICPYCEKQVTQFTIQMHPGQAGTNSWKCISINCPSCSKSLGVQVDPIAIKTDTIKALQR